MKQCELDKHLIDLRHTGSIFRKRQKTEKMSAFDISECYSELRRRHLSLWPISYGGKQSLVLVRGTIPRVPMVAIVGSRAVDPYGRSCSRQVARLVIDLGFGVISGGAEGCDAEAHRVSVASGQPTVVVLGHGHDYGYPSHHRELFQDIIRSGGATVSPYWPTVPPRGFRFRERNRVIASLAHAVVVVRARSKSGSLSTARFAMKFGCPVLAVPSNLGDSYGSGSNDLLAKGAIPLVEPASLASTLGVKLGRITSWPGNERGSPAPWSESDEHEGFDVDQSGVDPHAKTVLDLLKNDAPLDLDTLHMRSGLSIAQISACLLDLEVQGLVFRTESDDFYPT